MGLSGFLPATMIEENAPVNEDVPEDIIAAIDYPEELDNVQAVAYVNAMLEFSIGTIEQFMNMLDKMDSRTGNKVTMSDVMSFEKEWQLVADNAADILETMNKKIPNSQCEKMWEMAYSLMEDLESMAIALSDWDTDGNGQYSKDEIYNLIYGYIDEAQKYDEKYIIPIL